MNSHASMMVGDALSPSGFGSRHHAPSDSRLLMNLIKAERTYCGHLHSSVMSAHGASSALSSWGTSETPDVAEASARLADLLTACADVQSTHVSAIEGYRSALKDVADREASIRTVVRDRDILVSRLIKASQKSGSASSKKSPEERAEKVAKAQRELAACEEVLTHEEAALVGVKRRTFKEALTMRMKTMGDAGAAMVEAAQEAILLLNDFDSSADLPRSPVGYGDGFGGVPDGFGGHHHMDDYQQEYHDMYDAGGYGDQHQDSHDMHAYHNPHEMGYGGQGMDDQAQYAVNHHAFENASVTPSQSASQIYNPAASNRESWQVPFPGSGNGMEGEHGLGYPAAHPAGAHGNMAGAHDSDSDNDEDWRQAFNGENTTAHAGGASLIPAPHHLGANTGTTTFFAPQQQRQGQEPHQRSGSSPAPPLPDKDPNTSRHAKSASFDSKPQLKKRGSTRSKKSETRKEEPRTLNYVPMPPIPSAPRFDASGVNMGPIPTAPKLYMPGASGEQSSSSEDLTHRPGAGRGGQSSWNSRIDQRRNDDDASSDGGHTARQGYNSNANTPSKKGLFGKMGKLFRAPSSGPGEADSLRQQPKPGKSSTGWRTRTDSNIKARARMNDPASIARKQDVLTGPLVAPEEDSSDEEGLPDPRHLVRHVNQGPPMWQNKASSDLGTSSKLLAHVPRPKALKRTPSASVTAGPKSFKAQQEASSRVTSPAPSADNATMNSTSRAGLQRSTTNSTITTKKKKKKSVKPQASMDDIASVRARPASTEPTSSARGAHGQTSITVPGDASSGVRRNDSLNRGSTKDTGNNSLAARSSKRLSQMSTHTTHSNSAPKAGAMRPIDPQGKYATSNWVAKSNEVDERPAPSPAPAIEKSKAQKSAPAAAESAPASKPPAPAPQRDAEPPRHVPQPSRTMSPPLKPALKAPGASDLARSGSINSSLSGAGAFQIPVLPAPISAPPRVSDTLANQDYGRASPAPKKPESVLSIEKGKDYDGSGALNMPEIGQGGQVQPAQQQQRRTELPRIDMPQSEPFRVDLENQNKAEGNGQAAMARGGSTDAILMTPNEQQAVATFLSQQQSDGELSNNAVGQESGGVTRSTVRRSTVGSGVLGPKNVPPPAVEKASGSREATEVAAPTRPSAPRTLSRSYSGGVEVLSSDSSDDERPMQAAAAAQSGATSVPQAPAAQQPSAPATSSEATVDHTPEGSGVSRRKSVRMAPDVKFPPETPPGDTVTHHSKQQHHRGTPSSASHSGQLSSRIAPPPPAPPRLHVPSATDRPVDLGAGTSRERAGSSWSTRIGTRHDDSSDEEDDEDGYAAARRSFGSASRGWSAAMGRPGSVASSKKKKKASASKSGSGYNPAVPLPVGMEVVGRSASFRRK